VIAGFISRPSSVRWPRTRPRLSPFPSGPAEIRAVCPPPPQGIGSRDSQPPASPLLRPRRHRPRRRSAAEDRDELSPFQLIELHSVPAPSPDQPRPDPLNILQPPSTA